MLPYTANINIIHLTARAELSEEFPLFESLKVLFAAVQRDLKILLKLLLVEFQFQFRFNSIIYHMKINFFTQFIVNNSCEIIAAGPPAVCAISIYTYT